MYDFFVGIDVSKDVIDVAIRSANSILYLGQFENNQVGFERMLIDCRKQSNSIATHGIFCFENTGVYSKSLLFFLIRSSIPCLEENALQIKRSQGIKRGKNDKVDAMAICQYVFEKRDSIVETKLEKDVIRQLKKLLSVRDLYVKQKNALKVSFKESLILMDQSMKNLLEQQNIELVENYERSIRAVEKRINELIGEDEQLKKNNNLLQSIKGIGPVIAAHLITTTNNFTRFENARQYACYCGIAPFTNSSGKFKGRNKTSPLANKKIKSLLGNGICAAVTHDPQLKRYKDMKLSQGKPKGVVYNNIKNKIIQRAFAVIKRQSPYLVLQ